MTIAVRHALPADADAIAEAHTAAWRSAYRGLFTDAYLDSDEHALQRLDRWRRRLRDGAPPDGDVLNELFAVELDHRVVGFGHAGREDAEVPGDRGEVYGSCNGSGDDVVEVEFVVPPLTDVPDHPSLTEIQYRIDL